MTVYPMHGNLSEAVGDFAELLAVRLRHGDGSLQHVLCLDEILRSGDFGFGFIASGFKLIGSLRCQGRSRTSTPTRTKILHVR